MFDFHGDRKRYFDIQVENTHKYVIPFVREAFSIKPGMRVMEIGCGEGGVLKAFTDNGCIGVGVEMDLPRIELGAQWLQPELASGKIKFVGSDIYLVEPESLGGAFDIIVLKDVIEHIHQQDKLMTQLKKFLKPGGVIFFGFPPWQMPFGGHQQMCKGKWLSKLPYYHLLPRPLYKAVLKANGEPYEDLLEIRDTRLSIEKFRRVSRLTGYKVLNKHHYFINPIYEWKFGLKARKQLPLINSIPWVRNFLTTCVYYLLTAEEAI